MHYVKEKHKISSLNKWQRPKNLPITLYYIYSAVFLDYLFCKYISVEAKYYANMFHTYIKLLDCVDFAVQAALHS